MQDWGLSSILKHMEVLNMHTLGTRFNKTAIMTPAEYLKFYTAHPERIKRAQMLPPRLGKDKHFGKFRVVFALGHYGENY